MNLPPVQRNPRIRSVVISGASRGLGAALALRFAAPGVRLLLVARGEAGLREVAAACAARGAAAGVAALDVSDAAALAAALARFEAAGPVDLVIANAGISAGRRPDGSAETAAEAARQVEVNLLGAMHLVGPLLPGMVARKAGRVAWGEALRASLRGSGVGVTVISPGFFDSAMGDRFEGSRPLLMSMDAAAGRIHRGILGGRGRLVFPWPLGALLRVLALLPPGIGDWAIRRMRFRVRPEAP